MSSGHIRQRGPGVWQLKYDTHRDAITGRRVTRYRTVKGTKAAAQRVLRELLAAVDRGTHVDPSKVTVGSWLQQWLAEVENERLAEDARALQRDREEASHPRARLHPDSEAAAGAHPELLHKCSPKRPARRQGRPERRDRAAPRQDPEQRSYTGPGLAPDRDKPGRRRVPPARQAPRDRSAGAG